MITIDTNLSSVRLDIDNIGQSMFNLIKANIPGLVGGNYGLRSIGTFDPAFPAFFVEAIEQDSQMLTTGKYHIKNTYAVYVYVIDNVAEDTLSLLTFVGNNLIKLFSNNALNDLSTNHTSAYKSYPGYWFNCEMKPFQITPYFPNPIPPAVIKYMRIGRMLVTTENVVLM